MLDFQIQKEISRNRTYEVLKLEAEFSQTRFKADVDKCFIVNTLWMLARSSGVS